MKKNVASRLLRLLVISAFLAAVSIVCGKYLAISVGEVMRFSFENLPIIFAGMAFGPIVGAAVGAVADLIGCLLVGYAINPIITLGAVHIGAISGLYRFLPKRGGDVSHFLAILFSAFLAHGVGSVIIKTFGLSVFYDMPLGILMLWRLLNYVIVASVEVLILFYLMKNKMITSSINSIIRKNKKHTERGEAKMMSYTEALEYIHGVNWTFCKPGLERISELCAALGNPERRLKFVHVAGTNGKGSFCSMLDSILRAEGYKVGLYTSPYILEFNERMRVNGENISNEKLAQITEKVRPIADAMKDKPTEFELITAIAFEYFAEQECDIVVLEAGMGGRLDSTNVIASPVMSVITGIALDHTAFLGDTVEKIAAEKAGIIKCGSPVVLGACPSGANEVISLAAERCGSEIFSPDYSQIKIQNSDLSGTEFDYKEYTRVKIKLLGSYQPRNAALVLTAVDALRALGYPISDSSVYNGLLSARWSARFEVINENPLFIFDGAHNPDGISAAVESIERYFDGKGVIAVSGVLSDKDYDFIAKKISTVAKAAFTVTPDNPRALSAEKYAALLSENGVEATAAESIDEAVRLAMELSLEKGLAVVSLGSLYTYGDVLRAVKKQS